MIQSGVFGVGNRALWSAIAVLGALSGFTCTRSGDPPSFIVILVDTLRADYLGCYGFDGPVSPHVDALARESYVFRRCYASAPWTKPSVASLFTSLNPISHGVTNHDGDMWGGESPDLQKGVLRADASTLAERLHARGYRTAAFVANPWLTWQYGFDQGFDVYSSIVDPPADRVALEAERWLASTRTRVPFLLYVHLMDVHSPYNAPDSTYEKVRESPSIRSDVVLSQAEWEAIPPSVLQSRWTREADGSKKPETRSLETWRGRYAADVRDLDDRIGPFLERLRKRGLLDNSYVILTSDHGEALHDHGNWDHGYTLYEDQIHVPLIIRPPGGLNTSWDITEIVGLIDILPTLVGWSGEVPQDVEGRDLAPLLAGSGSGGSGVVLSTAVRTNPRLHALSTASGKLLVNGATNRLALFDVVRDPAESRNLAPEMPEEVRRLRSFLEDTLEEARQAPLFQPTTPAVSAERRELLESLGYMN